MKCLSIKQPWAWAILNAGKDIENRSWKTEYRGPLLIHAGKTPDQAAMRAFAQAGYPVPRDLALGAIVGRVDLVAMARRADTPSAWFQGPWGWVLANPVAFQFPVYAKGQLGLFDVDDAWLNGRILAAHDRAKQQRAGAGR